MHKDKQSKWKKEETYEKMDKELLEELSSAENEGLSMGQYLINNRKIIKKRNSKFLTKKNK